MINKPIPAADVTFFPPPRDLTPEEEKAIIAQYKAERSLEDLEGEYGDFDRQVADGLPAKALLAQMR
jgi:hypothetical protein